MYPTLNPNKALWRHQMETFSVLLAICAGNSPVPGEFMSLSGVPDYFYRNKISSGGDLSHYSSASLY